MVHSIGSQLVPMGYIAITLKWYIELGVLEGIIDEFFISDKVLGRSIETRTFVKLLETFLILQSCDYLCVIAIQALKLLILWTSWFPGQAEL